MKKKNQIGLDGAKALELSNKLNHLLADYHVFYMNVRGFHWNIKGDKFFELHLKFEELYNDLQLKIDEIAERILTLGETPLHSYSDFLKHSNVKEAKNLFDARSTVQSTIEALQTILELEREILKLSGEAEDEGTNALMSDYIREKEKLIWMYKAYLS